MERLEDLNVSNLKIYQDNNLYCFTSDAVILSRFAKVKHNDVVADFCSGSGIVGFHLYGLNDDKIKRVTLFELQKPLYELSVKSINLNNLTDKFTAINADVTNIGNEFCGKFSLIVCNPPYTKPLCGAVDDNPEIAVCKSEIKLTLKKLIQSVSYALKFGGRVCMVHRADRIAEVIATLTSFGLEPKKLQLVSAKNKEPYLFLIEAVKGGKPGVKVLNTLIN